MTAQEAIANAALQMLLDASRRELDLRATLIMRDAEIAELKKAEDEPSDVAL